MPFSYFFYLHDIPVEKSTVAMPRKEMSTKIKNLAVNLSPIYAGLVLNILLGLRFSVCLTVSIVILYFLGPKKGFVKLLFKSIGVKLILTMVAIFFVQQTILSLDELIGFFTAMFHSGAYSLFAILFATLFFVAVTGHMAASVAVVLPLVASLDLSVNEILLYVYFMFCPAFCGYFFSPLHMCQILTTDYIGVTLSELWKEYIYLILFLIVFFIVSFFALRLILT